MKRAFVNVHVNNVDALIPELWANYSLAILEENLVAAALVYRDFEDEFAKHGDIVHTRKPAEFTAKRKDVSDNVMIQDAISTDVQVPLDQHVHTSFLIRDGEETKSMVDLVETFIRPAMIAQARFVDQVILGQYHRFLYNNGGRLGNQSSTNIKDSILETRQVMNVNKAYMDDRYLIMTPSTETTALQLDTFVTADKVGDNGTALRRASMGERLGFNLFMSQNMPTISVGNTVKAGAINLAAGYVVGDTVLTVDGFTGAVAVGEWVTIAGDDVPYRIVAHTETLGNTTSITINRGLKRVVADNAIVTSYTAGKINLAAGYAVGYSKELVVDTFTVAPQVGQLVSFGLSAASVLYTIIAVTGTTGITLDRPLEVALADNAEVNIGPRGNYNLAFHRLALALVVRPLVMPRAGTGALSYTVNMNSLSMRAVITYDGDKQGHLVTLDMLMGVACLDPNLGAVMFG